ncbi:polyketide synthase dehydratase domain-containing protein, partial [Streptomyces mayteni]
MLTAAGHAHTTGLPIHWPLPPTTPVDLPTYPFQHQHYWLHPTSPTIRLDHLGQADAEHALLTARIDLPDGTTLFTGRLSLETHPWLADHAVATTPLLPGTAYLDLALHAAHTTTHPHIEELTLHTPLTLDHHPTHLRLTLTPPHNTHRTLTIHTQPHTTTDPTTHWTLHATATLTTTPPPTPPQPPTTWPPTNTQPHDLTNFYDTLATTGYHYGPTFQGLTHAWHNPQTHHHYANITLPPNTTTTHHTLHPALLDATLHTTFLNKITGSEDAGDQPESDSIDLPFSFTDTHLYATHATHARAHLTTHDNHHTLHLTTPDNQPILTTTLTTRPTN